MSSHLKVTAITILGFAFYVFGSSPFINSAYAVDASCNSPANAIVKENCLTGNPVSEWDIQGIGDPLLQGFATNISVNKGETISFKIDTDAANYHIDVYRLGYYGGLGARKIDSIPSANISAQVQPPCLEEPDTGLVDCGNWNVSATWSVPANATSGVYIAKLIRDSTGNSSHVFFIVRDDNGASELLFQTSDTTWQAYNDYGGYSLYTGITADRAYKVSYNRPFYTRGNQYSRAFLFDAGYPMLRWLEANGYDISYTTGVDSERRGNEILEHKVFLSVGHDEYWSSGQRANVESARNAGVNLAFFSGNEIFWKTRWENSLDATGTPYRTLVTYKETKDNAKIDPLADIWTGTWRDPRFSPPADGGKPENALSGNIFMVNCCLDGLKIQVPQANGKFRFWRDTIFATLPLGQIGELPAGILGYEWDVPLENGFSPAGLIKLSSTPVNLSSLYLIDYGSSYGAGTATHSLTLYRHNSRALVFGAGTIRWPWGLDNHHDPDLLFPIANAIQPNLTMQQATVNLLADMGVQLHSPQIGLVAATQSTDITAPVSTITSPLNNTSIPSCSSLTITGTAIDNIGGGVITSIEISTDGGTTWHKATGRENWTYTWSPEALGNTLIKSRAYDDSGNVESLSPPININVISGGSACSFWNDGVTPENTSDPDTNSVELGFKFSSDVAGYISAIRFYKGPGNTGVHVGNLWTSAGTLLSSATFTNETATGWQQVNFPNPIPIDANTVYVASYFAPNGHYAGDVNYFRDNGLDRAPLHALKDGLDGGNGVYAYGSTSFPSSSFASANYWVDVVFTNTTNSDQSPPSIPTNLVARFTSNTTVNLTWTASTDNVAVVNYLIERCLGVLCDTPSFTQIATTNTPSFQNTGLTAGNTYRYRLRAIDAAGNLSAYSQISTTTTATTSSVPVAITDTFLFKAGVTRTVDYSGPLGLGVLANDTDRLNQTLSSQIVGTAPTGITLASNGVLTIERSTGVNFKYRASNSSKLSLPITGINVLVRANSPPKVLADLCIYNKTDNSTNDNGDCFIANGDRSIGMLLTENDTDPNTTTNLPSDNIGNNLTKAIITSVGGGVSVLANPVCNQLAVGSTSSRATITNNCDGSIIVRIADNAPLGFIRFGYKAYDDLGSASAAVINTITVTEQ